MSEETKQKDPIATALTVVSAILVFRIVEAILRLALFQLGRVPWEPLVVLVFRCGFMLVPAISVAVAVLTCRWHEDRLASARQKTRVGLLVILAVLAFFPLRVKTSRRVTMVPAAQMQIEESEGEDADTSLDGSQP
jgi:hypothetical protein